MRIDHAGTDRDVVETRGDEPVSTMTSARQERFVRTFEARPASARSIRRFVCDTLLSLGASAAIAADLELVVSELSANAIEHGRGPTLQIVVDASDPVWWNLEVNGSMDRTTSSAGSTSIWSVTDWTVADPHAPSGRGLGIVRELVDDIEVDADADHVRVLCRRRRTDPRYV